MTRTQYYAAYLQAMIADWRTRKNMGDFSFLPMMLPPSVAQWSNLAATDDTGRPDVRAAELLVVPRPGGQTDIAGVPTTVDLGGASAWGFDHPPNKNVMAHRLALQTLHVAYALQGRISLDSSSTAAGDSLWTGPVVREDSVSVVGSTVVVSYSNWSAVGLGLRDVVAKNINGSDNSCRGCCAEMPPFELLDGASGNWTRAPRSALMVDAAASTVTIQFTTTVGSASGNANGGAVVLGAAPEAVRYAWSDYVECVVVNSDDLPAAPFSVTLAKSTADVVAESTEVSAAMNPAMAAPFIQSPPRGFNSWCDVLH